MRDVVDRDAAGLRGDGRRRAGAADVDEIGRDEVGAKVAGLDIEPLDERIIAAGLEIILQDLGLAQDVQTDVVGEPAEANGHNFPFCFEFELRVKQF